MTFFIICFGVGFLFLIVTAFMGGLTDIGGPDVDVDTGAGTHLSPLSPILIAFFLTVFGGSGGVATTLWGFGFPWALLFGLVTALCSATILYFALLQLFLKTEGGVEVNVADMAGKEAEVITSIPEGGMGEIAFITSGGRLNGPARSEDGQPIAFNSLVRIVKVVGGSYIVQRIGPPPAPPSAAAPSADSPSAGSGSNPPPERSGAPSPSDASDESPTF